MTDVDSNVKKVLLILELATYGVNHMAQMKKELAHA